MKNFFIYSLLVLFLALVGCGKESKKDIEIAKKIGTFETSIKPFEDCCTVFLPDSPVVRPELYKVLREQEKIDFDAILDRAMAGIEIVEIKAD